MATIKLTLTLDEDGLFIRGVRTYQEEEKKMIEEDRVLEVTPEKLSQMRYTTRIVSAEAAQIIKELLDLGPEQ